jgi:hypothetical protein
MEEWFLQEINKLKAETNTIDIGRKNAEDKSTSLFQELNMKQQ